MYNQERLHEKLTTNINITSLLGEYDFDGNMYPMIVFGDKIPEDWAIDSVSIDYQLLMQLNAEYKDSRFTLFCRAGNYVDSFNLAAVVKEELHRDVTDVAFYCKQLKTLPPVNDRDSYHTPVEVKILGR